jgi:hypothetical protein
VRLASFTGSFFAPPWGGHILRANAVQIFKAKHDKPQDGIEDSRGDAEGEKTCRNDSDSANGSRGDIKKMRERRGYGPD